jgi:repressor LexA
MNNTVSRKNAGDNIIPMPKKGVAGRRKSAEPEAEYFEQTQVAPRRARNGGRRKSAELSKKQQDILGFIETYIEKHNWPPTVREIQDALKISSTSVVDYNLDALVQKNKIRRNPGKSRAIELIDRPRRESDMNLGQLEYIPVAGTIAAGVPISHRRDEDYSDRIEVPSMMFRARPGKDVFALRVKGESMIDALIADGDIVLIRSAETAERGETVAVWLEDEQTTTLKKWYPEANGKIRLQPANSTMEPIYTTADNARVKGKLIGVIRTVD